MRRKKMVKIFSFSSWNSQLNFFRFSLSPNSIWKKSGILSLEISNLNFNSTTCRPSYMRYIADDWMQKFEFWKINSTWKMKTLTVRDVLWFLSHSASLKIHSTLYTKSSPEDEQIEVDFFFVKSPAVDCQDKCLSCSLDDVEEALDQRVLSVSVVAIKGGKSWNQEEKIEQARKTWHQSFLIRWKLKHGKRNEKVTEDLWKVDEKLFEWSENVLSLKTRSSLQSMWSLGENCEMYDVRSCFVQPTSLIVNCHCIHLITMSSEMFFCWWRKNQKENEIGKKLRSTIFDLSNNIFVICSIWHFSKMSKVRYQIFQNVQARIIEKLSNLWHDIRPWNFKNVFCFQLC